MGQFVSIESLFHGVKMSRKGSEIKAAATKKVTEITAKIAEREKRIVAIRKAHDINDTDLIDLLRQAANSRQTNAVTYTLSASNVRPPGANVRGRARQGEATERMIPAGVVSNLNTEASLIEAEKNQIKRLALMARNVATAKSHDLCFEDLEFLGF